MMLRSQQISLIHSRENTMKILIKTLLSSSLVALAACQTSPQGQEQNAALEAPRSAPSAIGRGTGMGTGEEARKGYIEELDSNSDGRVSRAEVEQFRNQRFSDADTNRNGVIDETEYVDEYAARLDRQIDSERKSHVEQTNTRFKSLDKNDDGVVSWDEYKASGDRAFAHFDPDNSGRVSASEEQLGKPGTRTRGSSVLAMPTSHSIAGFMELYDDDADGVVTRTDFDTQRRQAFDATDSDGNGVLSATEYHEEFAARVERQAESVRERQLKQARVRFGVLDSDKNGGISLEEYVAMGMRSFNTWDTDGDGFVSAQEPLPQRSAQQASSRGDMKKTDGKKDAAAH